MTTLENLAAPPGMPRKLFTRTACCWLLLLQLVLLIMVATQLAVVLLHENRSLLRKVSNGQHTMETSPDVESTALETMVYLNATIRHLVEEVKASQEYIYAIESRFQKQTQHLGNEQVKLQREQVLASQRWREIMNQVEGLKYNSMHAYYDSSQANTDLSPMPGAMVIVEPRAHKDLQYVLENFDTNMPLNYDLYIFYNASHYDFVRQAARNVALHRHVIYIAMEVGAFSGYEEAAFWYNNLLRSKEQFWDKVDAEKVLTFQSDSVLCGNSPRTIHDFEHLGYIGCGYDRTAGQDSAISTYWGEWPFWGNGGVTFHQKSKALECLSKFRVGDYFPEDVFFSACVGELGIGRRAESGKHLSEFCTTLGRYSTFTVRSFAAHKVNAPMELETGVDLFLDYCPEAKPLLGRQL